MKDILAFLAVVIFFIFLFSLLSLIGCQWMKDGGSQDSISVNPLTNPIPSIPKSINWLAAISIIGLAFSVAALVNGYKWGMGGAVGSGIALWAVITVNQYAKWIAVIGLLMGIVVLVVAVLRNKKVLVDVIKSVEKAKENMASTVIGDMDLNCKLLESASAGLDKQKPITQKIVNKIRKKLNGKKESEEQK